MLTVLLLICSNVFMTTAWYGHLRFPRMSMTAAIFASWGIALLEYVFQVPGNRIGHERYHFSAPQLKLIQEAITIPIFLIFNWLVLKETVRPTDWLAFALILGAILLLLVPRQMAAGVAP